jgi:membrane associated rhomboid family serine protease
MTDSRMDPFELILRQCAEAAPAPWYPRAFAETTGIPRETLDPFLDQLRLRGLVRLTDWVSGNGQGYALTPEGERVLRSPSLLAQLRTGRLPAARPQADEEPRERGRAPSAYERGEAIRNALLGSSQPVVTYVLLAANILVFVWGMALANRNGNLSEFLSGTAGGIVHQTGGITGFDLQRGQWWRLLTCCFVHFGVLHLGVNMYSLWVIGPLSEKMWGRWRYLAIYLISGLVGSCAMELFSPSVLGGGASGALWGLLAAFGAWVFLNRAFLPPALASTWLRQIVIILVLNVGISFMPGISKEAHFGGGIGGLIVATLLNYGRFAGGLWRWLALAGVVLLPVIAVGALVQTQKSNPRWRGAAGAVGDAQEKKEIQEFNEQVLHPVNLLQSAAEATYDADAKALLSQNPRRRDPAAVATALTSLGKAREQLNEAVEILAKAGPYSSEFVENARTACKDYTEQHAKLFELYEQCLQQGEKWTEKDEQGLKEQQQRVKDAQQRWHVFVGPS